MSHQQLLSKGHPNPIQAYPTSSKIYTTVSETFRPFHSLIQSLAQFLDPFNPSQIPPYPPHPSITDFDFPLYEDVIMYNHHRSFSRDESPRRERVARRVPSMERMQSPIVVSPQASPIPTFTSTTSTSTSTRMSTPELEGSEYLEPMLAESTYARQVESSVLDTAHFESKPWGYERYMGLQRRQTGGDAGIVKTQPAKHRSLTHVPQYIESSRVHEAPLTAEEQEERGRIAREWRAREEREKKETEEDNALMDSFGFEPTIGPYMPKI
ncbi:hypothetical protein EYC84_008406 [Monilinia fructicola]|uniref:Uncharacterized protein n=1 Tax=Monilinia fructicola TaxID=38448 RepID=A0A5M9JJR4_MONFR|nr:hypothetical protein EYC84_008406 [Monilinia fructicola]